MDSSPRIPVVRVRLLYLGTLVAVCVLALRLWQIQFVRGSELKIRAAANRFVAREVDADRGVIYDVSGQQVVFNRPRFTVSVVTGALPNDEQSERKVLSDLAGLLGMPLDRVPARQPSPSPMPQGDDNPLGSTAMGQSRQTLVGILDPTGTGAIPRSWQAIPVARNVSRDAAFRLMERAGDLPGVVIGEAPVREYPSGPTLAHMLGFSGSIPEEQLDDYARRGYAIYDVVGRDGLEATYEQHLRGVKGRKWVEVDAMGRELRSVGAPEPSVPGHSLYLTIDLGFQREVEDRLADGLRRLGARSGAVVALDPRSGAVRAMVSWPAYDNNMFSVGASPSEFAALLANEDRPLLNRAISGQYAPGSVFKLVTASAALEEGVITAKTRIFDPGMIELPNEYDPSITYPFLCWLRSGHGSLPVVGALAHSCDVFFYEVAGGYYEDGANQEGLGSARLARYAEAFGLGAATGVELLGEASGRVPTPDWLSEYNGEYWGTGLTYQMGIGQGYLLVTPLQIANMASAVANGGTLYRPHLVERVVDAVGTTIARPGGVIRRVPVAPEYLALVREGMRGAVDWGTARRAWSGLPSLVTVGGKTGTAEFCDRFQTDAGWDCRRDREGYLLTHAWFAAFAPVDDPEIVVVAFVDGTGMDHVIEGSRDAAPIVGKVLSAWFDLPDPVIATATAGATGQTAGEMAPTSGATPAGAPGGKP